MWPVVHVRPLWQWLAPGLASWPQPGGSPRTPASGLSPLLFACVCTRAPTEPDTRRNSTTAELHLCDWLQGPCGNRPHQWQELCDMAVTVGPSALPRPVTRVPRPWRCQSCRLTTILIRKKKVECLYLKLYPAWTGVSTGVVGVDLDSAIGSGACSFTCRGPFWMGRDVISCRDWDTDCRTQTLTNCGGAAVCVTWRVSTFCCGNLSRFELFSVTKTRRLTFLACGEQFDHHQ